MTPLATLKSRLARPLGRFRRETRGTVSVELVIVLPVLLWALAASVVFYDGFRNRYHAQMAAQTVADIMSRETDLFTASYIEGLNEVYDFLADSRYPTRLRVSSVIWDSTNQRNRLQWSYGTRGLSPLPDDTFELMQAGDYETLRARFGDDESFSFAGNAAQMPVTDLPNRIPPVLPGEALLLVEAFGLWSPFANVGIGQTRFTPVVVVRPRFAPWINFEGIDPVYPEDNYEIAWTGGGGNDSLPDPHDPDPDPDPDPDSATSYDFNTGVTTGWSAGRITANGPSGGFLGPFGLETYQTPVTLDVAFSQAHETARIAFDLLVIDTWDGFGPDFTNDSGDTLQLMIDGTPITMDAFHSRLPGLYGAPRSTTTLLDGAQYTVTMTLTSSGTSFAGQSREDQIWRVTLDIARPPRQFQLGFSATVDSAIDNESFGIDNVTITASGAASGTPYFTPDAGLLVGRDRITRFPQYGGAPDHRLAAPWVSMRNDDLSRGVAILRHAGGPTNLGSIPTINGHGYVMGSPSLVLNYDSQGATGRQARLEVRMDDGNNGYTCDTTLLVRDPNGQWWFNDDFGRRGWNAGLQMGNAPSGAYTIWIGTYGPAQCASTLLVDAY
ncbi:MAG: hypothetical protein Kow0013_10600 [Pararhodobacter sp.]